MAKSVAPPDVEEGEVYDALLDDIEASVSDWMKERFNQGMKDRAKERRRDMDEAVEKELADKSKVEAAASSADDVGQGDRNRKKPRTVNKKNVEAPDKMTCANSTCWHPQKELLKTAVKDKQPMKCTQCGKWSHKCCGRWISKAQNFFCGLTCQKTFKSHPA